MKNINCIIYGLGYIGLPTAVYLASKDINVYGLDVDLDLVNKINKGNIETTESGLSEMLSIALKNNKFKAGKDYLKSDIHIIVVPTPFKDNNEPDTSIVEDVASKLADTVKKDDLIILESTSPVGTTEKVARIMSNAWKSSYNYIKCVKSN